MILLNFSPRGSKFVIEFGSVSRIHSNHQEYLGNVLAVSVNGSLATATKIPGRRYNHIPQNWQDSFIENSQVMIL